MRTRRERLDDRELKALVERWQARGEAADWDEIVSRLAGIVRAYPAFRHGRDEDTCSEFFAFVFPRLKDMLRRWRRTEAQFMSWFFVVLRRRYLDFVETERRTRTPPAGPLLRRGSRDPRKELDASDKVVLAEWRRSAAEQGAPAWRRELRKALAGLGPERRMLLHLLFDDLGPSDLEPFGDGRTLYEEYCRHRLAAQDRIAKERDRLTALGAGIVRLRRLCDTSAPDSEERARLERELERRRAAFERCRRLLMRHDPSPPYAWIARVTGRSVHSIKHDFQAVRTLVEERLGHLMGKGGDP